MSTGVIGSVKLNCGRQSSVLMSAALVKMPQINQLAMPEGCSVVLYQGSHLRTVRSNAFMHKSESFH